MKQAYCRAECASSWHAVKILSLLFPGQPTTSAWRSSMMKISLKSQMTVGLDSTMTRIHMRRWNLCLFYWSLTFNFFLVLLVSIFATCLHACQCVQCTLFLSLKSCNNPTEQWPICLQRFWVTAHIVYNWQPACDTGRNMASTATRGERKKETCNIKQATLRTSWTQTLLSALQSLH